MGMKQEEIEALSNEQLLEEVLDLAGGDDYDGCFTSRGWRTFERLKVELESRLLKVGFLEK
jgi:hypothetical protein